MNKRLAVFVPTATTPLATIVAAGSAIVGPAGGDETECVTVDYEGALYGPANMKTYADRARHAADRQLQHYPTVARRVVARRELLQVGWFDPENGISLLDEAVEVVASWLGVEAIAPQELRFSGPVSRLPWSSTNEFLP
jgi:hypothetical protein